MPAAHFLGLRPRLVFAQYPDDLLLAEATPFHRPSPFSGDGLYLISAEFSGCRPSAASEVLECRPRLRKWTRSPSILNQLSPARMMQPTLSQSIDISVRSLRTMWISSQSEMFLRSTGAISIFAN